MSIFNKCMVMIAFAICTTNAWAGQCKKQRVPLLNNVLPVPDVFYFSEDKVSDTIVNGYLCDKNCRGGEIVYFDRSTVIHSKGNDIPDKEHYGHVFCDNYGKWRILGFSHNDVFSEFLEEFVFCDAAGAEDAEVVFEYDGVKFAVLEGHVEVLPEERTVFVSGDLCVKRDTSKSTSDCGNVGQRECDGDYKFYVCKTDADCGSDHLPSNATAGHCVSAGRSGYKVCTATDCGENYELAQDNNGNSMGWCRKKSSNSGIQSDCAKLKFNDGTECSNINFGRSWKANSKFEGVVHSWDENIYGSCLDNKLTDKCNKPLWDLDTVDGQSVKDLVEGATSIDFHKDREGYEIEIFDCDREKGYVPGEVLHEWNNNPDEYSYKKCVKKSNNGESESGTTSATVFDDLDKFILEKFVGSSVWKNDDGGFNTARLVSDSVAGVVLGTAGGIITSHIIKKNQIENGFDDLKCTIGGQTVASYGDEFRVGVK